MFAALKARLHGLRTFITAGVVGAVGAAQTFGMVDITPLVRVFVKDENQLGAVMVLLGIAFGYLRYLTKRAHEHDDAHGGGDDTCPHKNVDAGM